MILKNKKSAIFNIISLIISVFAFSFILGGGVGFVSAEEPIVALCDGESMGLLSSTLFNCDPNWQSTVEDLFETTPAIPGSETTCETIYQSFIEIFPEYEPDTLNAPDNVATNCLNTGGGSFYLEVADNSALNAWNAYFADHQDEIVYPTPASNNCDNLWNNFINANPECVYDPLANPEEEEETPEVQNWRTQVCAEEDSRTYLFEKPETREGQDRQGNYVIYYWDRLVNAHVGSDNPAMPCEKTFAFLDDNWEILSTANIDLELCTINDIYCTGEGSIDLGDCIVCSDDGEEKDNALDGQNQDNSGSEGGEEEEGGFMTWINTALGGIGLFNSGVGNVEKAGKSVKTVKSWFAGGGTASGKAAESKVLNFIFKTKSAGSGPWHGAARFTVHVGVAVVIGYTVTAILKQFPGIDPRNAEAAGWAAGIGYLSAQTLAAALPGLAGAGPVALVAVGISAVIYAFLHKDYDTNLVSFSCNAWQPPSGGEYCEECNDFGILGCTEYQCKSLGRSCVLINEGNPQYQSCEWNNSDDIIPPTIQAWEEILDEDYEYQELGAEYPGEKGVKLVYKHSDDGCSPAFHQLEIGLKLNKFGRCKMDPVREQVYEDLRFGFGGGAVDKYNHSQVFTFPGTANLVQNGYPVYNDGDYGFYVRCESTNGYTSGTFVFDFCIEKGEDRSAPRIFGSSPAKGSYIPFNTSEIEVELYLDEPSQCKWDWSEKPYNEMANEIPLSSCANINESEINLQKTTYPCATTLTGIQDNVENNFYFKCMDQPELIGNENKRNVMGVDYFYVLDLQGTMPLALTTVGPQDKTITASNSPVKVELTATTEQGAENGKAYCQYSPTGAWNDYTYFDNSASQTHSTDVRLTAGNYNYYIQCQDAGGNFDTKTINFTVDVDESYSIITRAYKDNNYLKIITNEEAECRFSTDPRPESACTYSFDDGTLMNNIGKTQHFTAWDSDKNFYIKCKDSYGNLPDYDQCSVVIRPFDLA